MITALTITDITRMSPGFICVAGIDNSGATIRPQYRNHRIIDSWCSVNGHNIKPFSRVSLDLEVPRPMAPHTEDWQINDETPQILGECSTAEKQEILKKFCHPNVASIFGAEIQHVDGEGTFILSGSGCRSLGTIFAQRVFDFQHRLFNGRWDYRVHLVDQSGSEYRLKIVDLSFQTFIDHLRICHNASSGKIEAVCNKKLLSNRPIYLRIGLARGWANYPDRCYLQITGIFTFPDYLDNHCFQDYQQEIDAFAN